VADCGRHRAPNEQTVHSSLDLPPASRLLGMTCSYGKERVPSYVHEAASAFYLMRLRLLALLENEQSPGTTDA
jgi:hypothetical protein